MSKKRVGVIRGGISPEYEISLETGKSVLRHLPADKYQGIDILIDREGEWHVDGMPATLEDLQELVDVCFVALHGKYGEDGTVQQVLEEAGIPYTGSDVETSATALHKKHTKELLRQQGIKVPEDFYLRSYDEEEDGDYEDFVIETANTIFKKSPAPWVIKPVMGGSSLGMTLARTYGELFQTLFEVLQSGEEYLVEEYIEGREATLGIIDNFREQKYYDLPPLEIVRKGSVFFHEEKRQGKVGQEIIPGGSFTDDEKFRLAEHAKDMHHLLGCRHYSRSDFIIDKNGDIFALEINTLPGLTGESLVPQALDYVGASMPDFLDHVLTLTLENE